MNIEEYLVMAKGEDKTEELSSCECASDGRWHVIYKRDSKEFCYNYKNIEFYRNPRIVSNGVVVYEYDSPLNDVVKILDFGRYFRLIFKNGENRVCVKSSITFGKKPLKNVEAHECLEYLKELAGQIGKKPISKKDSLNDDVQDEKNFLSEQYEKLDFKINSNNSVLALYLEGKFLNKESVEVHPIFPFGFNLSQKIATEKALSSQISVIEGPPGTGKTQTILNIIANAVVDGKTVAVVSNNNSATANVLEKLQKYGVDFIAAYLGNKDNKERFFSEQQGSYPADMSGWRQSDFNINLMKSSMISAQRKLNKMLEYKNELAVLKSELSELETEWQYFREHYAKIKKIMKLRSFFKINSDKVMSLLIDYLCKIEKRQLSIVDKMYNFFAHGIFDWSFYDNAPETLVTYLQKMYYEKKRREIKNRIKVLKSELDGYNFAQAMEEYCERSFDLLKAELTKKYKARAKRKIFAADVIQKDYHAFINEYPVILSTTHSLRNCLPGNYLFDYVIIDEASQVDLVTGALALSCAKNAVIVGDTKQLPNVVTTEDESEAKRIFESFQLDGAYNYAEHSLLSSVTALYKEIPKTMLKEHYRCHPKIIGFCNQKFYNGQLIIMTDEGNSEAPLVLYKTAAGNHGRDKVNKRQIDVIFEEVIPGQEIDCNVHSVGVITPFRMQVEEIKKVVGAQNIEVDTIHKYQGREKDVIILSTVENKVAPTNFADKANLINVAVSRAIDRLIIVTADGSEEWKGTNLGDLVRYIRYNNFEIVESKIASVFDLLYRCHSEKLLEVMKKSKKVSVHKSEILMNTVIEEVLNEPRFQYLRHVVHMPLRDMIKNFDMLSEQERKYAENVLTHADFVIFSKLDKQSVLVVEVDGYAYHAGDPKQLERDSMKDGILNKYNIPILRIKTNEIGEKRKIAQKLCEGIAKLPSPLK